MRIEFSSLVRLELKEKRNVVVFVLDVVSFLSRIYIYVVVVGEKVALKVSWRSC